LLINALTCFGLNCSHLQGNFCSMFTLCFNLHVTCYRNLPKDGQHWRPKHVGAL